MNGDPANASLDQVLSSLQKMGIATGGAAAPAAVMPGSASATAQAGGRRKGRKTHRKGRKSHRKGRKSHRKSHRKSSRKNNRSRKNRK